MCWDCTSTITGLNIQRFETRKFSMIIEKWSLKKSIAMWKWPTRLREKDWMCVKALIRLETFSEPLVWEVMPLAAGRWKHLRDQRVDSASFFSSFSVGSGGYHSTSTIAPQANNLSVRGRPFPLGYLQRQQCRNCLVVGLALTPCYKQFLPGLEEPEKSADAEKSEILCWFQICKS